MLSSPREGPPSTGLDMLPHAGAHAFPSSRSVQALVADSWLAARNLARQPRRTAISVAAIAFGVIAIVLANGFIHWVFQAMRESAIRTQLGHIQVTRPGYYYSGISDPFAHLLPPHSRLPAEIEQIPHVTVVMERLYFSGLVSHGESTISFIAEAVEPEKESLFSRSKLITMGDALSSGDPKGIVLGQGLADNLGVTLGDRIVLLCNTSSGGINAVEGHVRGIFASLTKAYGDAALRVPISLARELLRVPGSNAFVILLDDTDRTEEIVSEIRGRVRKDELEVVPWQQLADFYNKTVLLFSRQVNVVEIIVAGIIVLSISNTLMLSVMERTGEIGTALALGITRRCVLRLFLIEGALLGVIGGTLGVVLAVVLAHAISAVGIPMPPPPGMSSGYTGEILITFPIVIGAFALLLGTTLLATAYPARRASRMVIIEALRHCR